MRITQRPVTILFTLCWLVMQTQVLASGLLGCAHQDAGFTADTAAACPLHAQSASPDVEPPDHGEWLLDCQACVLHCTIGTPALAAAALILPDLGGCATHGAALIRHLNGCVSDSLYRPPIA